jgi:hypothetical protein
VLLVFAIALVAFAGSPQQANSEVARKDFALQGTVDCGIRSGRRCAIDDTLRVWTGDIGNVVQQVVIDVTWMKRQVNQRGLDQDDLVCIEVRERPDGLLQGLGFVEPCEGLDGSINPGLSDGQREVSEQPKPPQLDPDREYPVDPTGTPTGAAMPTSIATVTLIPLVRCQRKVDRPRRTPPRARRSRPARRRRPCSRPVRCQWKVD